MSYLQTIQNLTQQLGYWQQQNVGLQQQVAARQAERQHLEALTQMWDKLVTWPDGLQWETERLRWLKATLEEQARTWKPNAPDQPPSSALAQTQAETETIQQRLEHLRLIENQLNQLDQLRQLQQTLRAKLTLQAEAEQSRLIWKTRASEAKPQLAALEAFQQAQKIRQTYEAQRQTCVERAHQLAQWLQGEAPEWGQLAREDGARLIQLIGKGSTELEKQVQDAEALAKTQTSQADERDQALAPLRKEVEALKKRLAHFKKKSSGELQELNAWAKALVTLKLDAVDGNSPDAVDQLRKKLQAKQAQLKWYREVFQEMEGNHGNA